MFPFSKELILLAYRCSCHQFEYCELVFEFFRKNKTRGKISEIFGKISEKLEIFGKIEFEKP